MKPYTIKLWQIADWQKVCSRRLKARLGPSTRLVVLRAAVIGLLALSFVSQADSPVVAISLRHQPAESLMPRVQALLQAGEVILPNGSEVLIQASPERTSVLKAWIERLDTPRHRLLISVVSANHAPDQDLHSAHTYSLPSRRQGGSVIEIQTLDGQAAQVHLTTSKPAPVPVPPGYYYPPVPLPQAEHRPEQGFSVIARVLNDQVLMEVESLSMSSQRINTSLKVRLGEWVDISRVSDRALPDLGDDATRYYTTPTREERLYLKVNDLDTQ
ncbi:MAG: hypothetical protein ACR2HF_06120 [Methylococcaceae bacterium]